MNNPYAYSQFSYLLLTCAKTGRTWRFATLNQAERAAKHLGLSDYRISEVVG